MNEIKYITLDDQTFELVDGAARAALEEKADRSEIPDISNLADKSEIPDVSAFITSADLPDLSGYALKTEIPAEPDLTDYAKKEDIPAAPDLSSYIKNTDIPTTTQAAGIKAGNWLSIDDGSTNAANRGKLKCGELTKAQYDSATGYTFISKTTLTNVLDDVIGDVDTVLEALGV